MLRRLPIVAAALLAVASARAQLVTDFDPPPSNCCLAGSAERLANQLKDWNQLGRYHDDNAALKRQPPDPQRVVFMGDSITDFWPLAASFPGEPYVNRGISGQTTPQMLVRMYPDVIDLKPAAVVILAGTNDISQNTGPMTIGMVEENLRAMTELAQGHGIEVLLCSLTPISDHAQAPAREDGEALPPHDQSVHRPPADILALNVWLKDYASRVDATYVDYYSAVVGEDGMFKDGTTNDGLHPNAAGYALMAPVVEAAIRQAVP